MENINNPTWRSKLKMPALIMAGNVLDYYDFLLFAHLGYLILPLFTPELSENQSHLLSMFLFGVAFVIRPLGGYLLGRISDLKNRRAAISQSILWSGIATLGLAILPTYEIVGILSTCLLIFFRLLQGVSVGGELPTAGTYLMESYPRHHGLLSGILGASGTMGSLLAFGFAWFCLQEYAPSWLWRVAFLVGGIACFISYFLRRNLNFTPKESTTLPMVQTYSKRVAIISTLCMGALIGVLTWLPVTYSNFYLTKILHMSTDVGLTATLMAILAAIFLKPFFGKISDYFDHFSFMCCSAFTAVPLILIGFFMIMQGNILGQFFLSLAAASFDAPVHAAMNSMFAKEHRSRSINLLFMLGLGVGGLTPSLCGLVVEKTDFHFFPAIFAGSIALMTGFTLLYFLLAPRGITINHNSDSTIPRKAPSTTIVIPTKA